MTKCGNEIISIKNMFWSCKYCNTHEARCVIFGLYMK